MMALFIGKQLKSTKKYVGPTEISSLKTQWRCLKPEDPVEVPQA